MSYRPWRQAQALRQMGRLPEEALDVLVRTLARTCEDPYDHLSSGCLLLSGLNER
jgi:hypothetical protein